MTNQRTLIKLKPYLHSLFWGITSGIFLALGYRPYSFRLLALISTIVFIIYTIKLLELSSKRTTHFILFLFFFLLVGRAIFLQDYLLIIANKSTINRTWHPFIFILMIAQVILPAFLSGSFFFALFKKKYSSFSLKNRFAGLLALCLVIEFFSEGQGPLSAFISLANLSNNQVIFNFWGHNGSAIFYYSLVILTLMSQELRSDCKAIPLVLLFSFLGIPYLKQQKIKHIRKINVVTINERITKDPNVSTLPLNFEDILEKTSIVSKNNFENKSDPIYYFWVEAALLQLPNRPRILSLVEQRLVKKLPGRHFIGLLNFKEIGNKVKTYSEYVYFDTATGRELIYQKNSLVPLDERPGYFRWIPMKYIVQPFIVSSPSEMAILKVDGIRFGIALCNEIMDIRELLNQNLFSRADIIINPSNVPSSFKNHFEPILDEFSFWVSKISGKPILRTSALNYVNWIDKDNPQLINDPKVLIHPMTLSFDVDDTTDTGRTFPK